MTFLPGCVCIPSSTHRTVVYYIQKEKKDDEGDKQKKNCSLLVNFRTPRCR